MSIAAIPAKAWSLACRTLLRLLALIAGGRPLSLDRILAIRRLASGADPLIPHSRPVDGSRLSIVPLARHLNAIELGTWALGPRALEVLVTTVETDKPSLIIEFGSGASTVALAWAISRLEGGPRPRVVSIEQDRAHAEKTRMLLERAGLEAEATVLVAPLASQTIEGVVTTCYSMTADVHRALTGRKAALVVIDGPAAESGARFGTLPLVFEYLADGARFILDDALRDGELDIALRWRRLAYIDIEGIRLVEKGLLVGRIRGLAKTVSYTTSQ